MTFNLSPIVRKQFLHHPWGYESMQLTQTARTRTYIANTPAEEIAATEISLFPNTNETVLMQCIKDYQTMGCWPAEMKITDSGYNAMLDIFEFDQKITQRHSYESICIRK